MPGGQGYAQQAPTSAPAAPAWPANGPGPQAAPQPQAPAANPAAYQSPPQAHPPDAYPPESAPPLQGEDASFMGGEAMMGDAAMGDAVMGGDAALGGASMGGESMMGDAGMGGDPAIASDTTFGAAEPEPKKKRPALLKWGIAALLAAVLLFGLWMVFGGGSDTGSSSGSFGSDPVLDPDDPRSRKADRLPNNF